MRRLTAALVLLALLLTGCVWSRRSVEKVCTEAAEALYAGELDRARAQHTVKPVEKTALSGRPCVAKTPERWYALVRGD